MSGFGPSCVCSDPMRITKKYSGKPAAGAALLAWAHTGCSRVAARLHLDVQGRHVWASACSTRATSAQPHGRRWRWRRRS
jgi:hypothetical protein